MPSRLAFYFFGVCGLALQVQAADPDQKGGWHGWPKEALPPAVAPYDAEAAKQHQMAWSKFLNVPVEYTNSIGMRFRLIPPGEFSMGSSPEEQAAAEQAYLSTAGTGGTIKSTLQPLAIRESIQGPDKGSWRVVRGGMNAPHGLHDNRSAHRWRWAVAYGLSSLGFRPAAEIASAQQHSKD